MGAMQSPENQHPQEDDAKKNESPVEQADSGVHKIDKGAIEAADAEKLAEVEENFFGEGEYISRTHEAGGTVAKNSAEIKGEANAETHAMRTEADKLKMQISDLEKRVADTESALASRGVDKPIEELADRAKSGFWGKVKRMVSNLGSNSAQENERLLARNDATAKELADKQSRYNELMNRLDNPIKIENAMKNKSERNQPSM